MGIEEAWVGVRAIPWPTANWPTKLLIYSRYRLGLSFLKEKVRFFCISLPSLGTVTSTHVSKPVWGEKRKHLKTSKRF